MSAIRSLLSRTIRRLFPYRLLRIVRRPALMPSDYRFLMHPTEYVKELVQRPGSLDDEYWAQMLRMYAHMIDKGVQRCDCEPGHSGTVYENARKALERIRSRETLEDPSVKWSRDRIARHEMLQRGEVSEREPWAPVDEEVYEDLLRLLMGRRSVRAYREEAVTEDTIRKIVRTFNWSPWSCHRQTGTIFVANEPDLARECLGTFAGGTGFSEFVPCFMCFCADLRAYALPRQLFVPMVDVGLGAQNCCLAAHALGLSLTLLSWAQKSDDEERRLRSLLDIPRHVGIVVGGVLGYPRYAVEPPARKRLDATYVLRGRPSSPALGDR